MMLSNSEIESLEDILFADPWGEDALDFFGLHGMVCASVVGPVSISTESLFMLATGLEEPLEKGVPQTFQTLIQKLSDGLAHSLDMGQPLELPEPEDGDPMNALENWCAGFVEAFLENEEAWLSNHEEEVAELLVPVLTLSGFYDDEDFRRVRESEKLSQQMANAIPDALTDLYLLFHAPE